MAAWLGYDGRPAAVKNFLSYSLRRLGTDHIDIYRLSRVDPDGADRRDRGRDRGDDREGIRAPRRTLRGGRRNDPARARDAPDLRPADRVLALLARASSRRSCPPRARSGSASPRTACSRAGCSAAGGRTAATGPRDIRANHPRFTGENLAHNLALVDALRGDRQREGRDRRAARDRVGCRRAATTFSRSSARARRAQLAEALGALDVTLTQRDLDRIERAVPPRAAAGDRYPTPLMKYSGQRAGSSAHQQADALSTISAARRTSSTSIAPPRRARGDRSERHRAASGSPLCSSVT